MPDEVVMKVLKDSGVSVLTLAHARQGSWWR